MKISPGLHASLWLLLLACSQGATAPAPPTAREEAQPKDVSSPGANAGDPAESNAAAASPVLPASQNSPERSLDVPPEWRCEVEVVALVSEENYRGLPNTPYQQSLVEAMSPEDFQTYSAYEHAESYRQCRYRVRVQSKLWHYTTTFSTTHEDLPEDWCRRNFAFIAADIQRTTHGCTELHRGAYYGNDLVLVDDL